VISCTELQEPQIYRITGERIIKIIDNSCTITGKNVILTAIDTITKDIHADFIPKTNMRELFNLIPERIKSKRKQKHSNKNKIELKLNDLHGDSQSLDDKEELINVEEKRQHNKKQHESNSYLYNIVIGLIIFTLVIMMLLCVIVRYELFKQAKEDPNLYTRMKYIHRPITTNKEQERQIIEPVDRKRIEKIYESIQTSRSPSPR
jgi:tetrahydromethanopterin S-methyltransferase subunit G